MTTTQRLIHAMVWFGYGWLAFWIFNAVVHGG